MHLAENKVCNEAHAIKYVPLNPTNPHYMYNLVIRPDMDTIKKNHMAKNIKTHSHFSNGQWQPMKSISDVYKFSLMSVKQMNTFWSIVAKCVCKSVF